jgi:hypothetical protein
VAKARAVDVIQGIVVETWVSAKNFPEIFTISPPYPADVTHHISVQPNSNSPLDFKVEGFIASGYSNVAFNHNSISQSWQKGILQVSSLGEETSAMKVSQVGAPARIQARNITYDNWGSKNIPVVLNKTPEWSLDVK